MTPKWLVEAEKHIGVKEIPGDKHNPIIEKWWNALGVKFNTDENDWCGIFLGAMLETVGFKSTRQQKARSYLNWGKKLDKPQVGCVAVFWREDPSGAFGHVAFYLGESESSVKILGGNQKNAVSIENRSKKYLLGYRWPTEKLSFWELLLGFLRSLKP